MRPSNSESAAPRHFNGRVRSSGWSILMCITGVLSRLSSPISPNVTRVENPVSRSRRETRCWKAARAVLGRKKNNPAVIARMATETSRAEAVRRRESPRLENLATVPRFRADCRISPLENVATPKTRKSKRNPKKLTREDKMQAASNSRKAITFRNR